MTSGAAPVPRPAASRRILNAARALVARGGAAEVSMGDVAAAAGVSKALVHYHFRDKESLLVALVETVGEDVLERERDAIASSGDQALDDCWRWLQRELELGDLRILLALAEYDSAPLRDAARRIAAQRRAVAVEHVAAIFARLGLVPRIAPALVAGTLMAFVDGLAAAQALDPHHDSRPAFDVLWLGLLTLGD